MERELKWGVSLTSETPDGPQMTVMVVTAKDYSESLTKAIEHFPSSLVAQVNSEFLGESGSDELSHNEDAWLVGCAIKSLYRDRLTLPVAKERCVANERQVGGNHYAQPIQPWDFIAAIGAGFFDGNAIKYLSRWKDKNGVEDLKKARHYIDKLIELEEGKQAV